MTKGYWIAFSTVSDPEKLAEYRRLNAAALARYGGRFLVRGGDAAVLEGSPKERCVVVEFPSREAALACYESEEYRAAARLRAEAAAADFVVVGGYDGPQPGDAA